MKRPAAEHDAFKPQGALKIFLPESCDQCKANLYINQSLELLKPEAESKQELVLHSDCFDAKRHKLETTLKQRDLAFIESMEEADLSDMLQNVNRAGLIEAIRKDATLPVLLAQFSSDHSKIGRIKSLCSQIESFKQRGNAIHEVLHSVMTRWPTAKLPNPESADHDDLVFSDEQVVEMLQSLVVILFDREPRYKVYQYLQIFIESWGGFSDDGASPKHLLVVLEAILNFPLPTGRAESEIIEKAISACFSKTFDAQTTAIVVEKLHAKGFFLDEEKPWDNKSILHWLIDTYRVSADKWDQILDLADALVKLGAKTSIKDKSDYLPLTKMIIDACSGSLSTEQFKKAFAIFSKNLGDDRETVNKNLFPLYEMIFNRLANPKEGVPNFPFIKAVTVLLLERFDFIPGKDDRNNPEWIETPLHLICRPNALTRDQAFEIAKLLLDTVPDLRNIPGSDGQTPLHLFCQYWGANAGKEGADTKPLLEQLRFFIQDGEVNLLDRENVTPLQYLAYCWIDNGATPAAVTDALSILVEGGHNINASEGYYHVSWILTELWFTSEISPPEILTALRVIGALGAEFDSVYYQSTLLHHVVKEWMKNAVTFEEAFPVVEFLLESKVFISQKNSDSQTIVHIICDIWLSHGITVDEIQKTLTAIFAKVEKPKDLLALSDGFGRTPILLVGLNWLNQGASVKEVMQGLQFLVQNGASADGVDKYNSNLLSYFVTQLEGPERFAGQELSFLDDLLKLAPGLTVNVDNRLSTPDSEIDLSVEKSKRRTGLNILWRTFPHLAVRLEIYATTPLHQIFGPLSKTEPLTTLCQLTRKIIAHERSLPNLLKPGEPYEGIAYKLNLKNKKGNTPLLAFAKRCLGSEDFNYQEFCDLLEDFFVNGAGVNASDANGDTLVTLFFRQDLSQISESVIWEFVWYMKRLDYNFQGPQLKDYRAKIQRAFIGASLEKTIPKFQKHWDFIYGLSKENLLEAEYKGLTLWHIGARNLSLDQFLDFLEECSDDLIARVFVKPALLLAEMDSLKAQHLCARVMVIPCSEKDPSAVARLNYVHHKTLILADMGQKLNSLQRISVYQYEENFEEAVKECCDYLQTCDAELKAQSQGVNCLIAMKDSICTQKIQPDRIVATLIQCTKERQFNRGLIAKMLKDFGLTWLFCYEYKSSIFYNGGSHKMTITRALIYLSLVNEKNQFFDTLKHRSQQDTPANKEWLDHLNEVLKAIKDPNNKALPDFLRGSEILMKRVEELQPSRDPLINGPFDIERDQVNEQRAENSK